MSDWTETEKEELKKLYISTNVTSDELIKDGPALDAFVAELNRLVNSNDRFGAEGVADQLLRLRKSGKLPRIRR